MTAIQLELNLDLKTNDQQKIDLLQKQVDALSESLGKVRRKLFAEVSELKKLVNEMKLENESLKQANKEKIEWIYKQDNKLFEDQNSISILTA